MSGTIEAQYSVYPVGYGNEEEGSWQHFPGEAFSEEEISAYLSLYRLEQQRQGTVYAEKLDTTGGGLYADGAHPELCTPECRDISYLVARMQSNEDRFADIVSTGLAVSPWPAKVIINRRVVDNSNPEPPYKPNSFGCHDSLGFHSPYTNNMDLRKATRCMLVGHLLTRPFVTGAGYFRSPNNLFFSQKMYTVLDEGTDTTNNMHWFPDLCEEETIRAEIRCSDVNISPWAAFERIACGGMAMAIGQTPLKRQFESFAIKHVPRLEAALNDYNRMPLLPDGTLQATKELYESISFQMRMAETFLSDAMIRHAGPPPLELIRAAQELYYYCEDMLAVVNGEQPYTILCDRADWAAKTEMVFRRIKRDTKLGIYRNLGDIRCQIDDIGYDLIKVTSTGRGGSDPRIITVQKNGYGYRLRDARHQFRMELPSEEVAYAKDNPPNEGRAPLRVALLKKYVVHNAHWGYLKLTGIVGDSIDIPLPGIAANELPPEIEARLQHALLRSNLVPGRISPGA